MKDQVTNKIIFAVGKFGAVILNCNDAVKTLTEEITGDRLDGLVDNFNKVPTEIGLYSGLLTVEYTVSELEYANNWDLGKITISGCMCLNKLEL
jgi:hypothetical protein